MRALLFPDSLLKKGFKKLPFFLTLVLTLVVTVTISGQQSGGEFVVVLDAGHGGHDPGNLGNGYLEKDIALNIVLNAGAILKQTSGVKVIYTRDDDTFVDLFVRGEIANKANADLFVSVHCDSHNTQASGAGTFVLGLHANKQNFEIAKKENSVIYLEDNYETSYADYDISSPESIIGLTIMQEQFLDQSIALAKDIQFNFSKKLQRKDRKVKQAGFIVLHQTFMPSVLVETGFLTNDKEGAYLNSKKGQTEMGKAIAEAIVTYKSSVRSESGLVAQELPKQVDVEAKKKVEVAEQERQVAKEDTSTKKTTAAEEFSKNPGDNPIATEVVEKKTAVAVTEKALEKVEPNPKKQIETVSEAKEETATGAVTENETTGSAEEGAITQEIILADAGTTAPEVAKNDVVLLKAKKEQGNAKQEDVATSNTPKKINQHIVFKVQLMASTKTIELKASNFGGLNKLSKEVFKQFHRYMYGNTDSFEQAELLKSNAVAKGYSSAYIVAYKDGVRIPTPDALKLVSEY